MNRKKYEAKIEEMKKKLEKKELKMKLEEKYTKKKKPTNSDRVLLFTLGNAIAML